MGTHDFNHDGKISGFDHYVENGLSQGGNGGGCGTILIVGMFVLLLLYMIGSCA